MLNHEYDVLTQQGWKSIINLKQIDKIAILKDKKYIEYKFPISIVQKRINAKMLYYRDNNIEINTNINNKIYCYNNDKKEFLFINELINNNNFIHYIHTGILNKEPFVYDLFKDYENTLAWIIFFSVVYSNGFLINNKIIIYYNENNKDLIMALDQLELNYKNILRYNKIIIHNIKLYIYLKSIKIIPQWIIELNKDQSRLFIKNLLNNNCFYTENEIEADRILQVLFHSGKYYEKKKVLKGFLLKEHKYCINNKKHHVLYDYNGPIYSIKVDNNKDENIYYVRKNNKCYWIQDSMLL